MGTSVATSGDSVGQNRGPRRPPVDTLPWPGTRWAVSERFQGIQVAGLVVVNVRDAAERPAAEQLLVDLARLRKDDALFNDILGTLGHRTPIMAVVANMADPRSAGRKKAVARVRRTIRAQGKVSSHR
jgi:hypothetical protein